MCGKLSTATVSKGLKEFFKENRIRKSGGGRKKLSQTQSNLMSILEQYHSEWNYTIISRNKKML